MTEPRIAGLEVRRRAAARLDGFLRGVPFEPLGENEIADARDRALGNKLATAAIRRHGQLNRLVGGMLDKGVPVDSANELGKNALMMAVENDNFDTVVLLLTRGADVNARTRDGQTALMRAARQGHLPVVELLLAHGGRRVDAGRAECCALFDGPVAAAHCAGSIVAALRRQGAGARLAFHCGELECHEPGAGEATRGSASTASMRVQGPAVEVAAGLLDLAEPGEVLTSATVTELAVGSGLEFDPRPSEGRVGGAGARAVMLYLVQRGDCDHFRLADDIDPAYAAGLETARQRGVETLCYACDMRLDGIDMAGALPLEL